MDMPPRWCARLLLPLNVVLFCASVWLNAAKSTNCSPCPPIPVFACPPPISTPLHAGTPPVDHDLSQTVIRIPAPLTHDVLLLSTATVPSFFIASWPPRLDRMRCGIALQGLYYDTELTAVLQLALLNQSAAVVIDIGANIGWATLYPAAMGHKVISFEAMPSTCDKLRLGIQANGFETRVDLHCAAAGAPNALDTNATVTVIEPVFGPGSSKIEAASDAGFTVVQRARVPLLRVSSVLRAGTLVRLAKLDIEGFEGVVLQDLLDHVPYRIPFIYVEVWPERWAESGVDPGAILQRLADDGYRLFLMGDRRNPGGVRYHSVPELVQKIQSGAIPLTDDAARKRTHHLHHDILAVALSEPEPVWPVQSGPVRTCVGGF